MTWLNKNVKNYGLFIGLYLVGIGLLFKLTGLDQSGTPILWLFYVAGPVSAYFMLREISKTQAIGYWRAMAMASVASLMGVTIYSLYVYGYNGFIDGSFLEYVRAQNLPIVTEGLTDPKAIEIAIQKLDAALTPPAFAAFVWLKLQIFYAVFTAVLVLVMKKRLARGAASTVSLP